jgi:hypothetical protein
MKQEIAKNKQEIEGLLRRVHRDGIEGLVESLGSTDFFTAPASTRLDYHGCKEGGLAEHSLNVYRLFDDKAKRFGLDLSPEEVIIASIAHDFCKIGIYVPNYLKSGKLSDSKPYVVQDNFPFGHGEKSVIFASKHIHLTDKEALLIRWHMGHYDAEWENSEERVAAACPAIYAFHNADMEASKYLDLIVKRK